MKQDFSRRDILKLLGVGGVVFGSGLVGCARAGAAPGPAAPPPATASGVGPSERHASHEDFFFLQLSDTHWGFKGDPNPEADATLKKAIVTVNAVEKKPDFVVFTGDLTHTTEDPKERRARMTQFKEIVAGLDVKTKYFLPGEHDASLDKGEAFHEFFGESHYSFDHKGVHFIALDNVSDPGGAIGDEQIEWLRRDLEAQPNDGPLVVLTHRPLFDLYPAWDWATRDGASVIALLEPHPNVTVFYGHIHQAHHHATGHIEHHAARSLVFPLPAPGSVPKKAPLPWDPGAPFRGLGPRSIERAPRGDYLLTELPVVRG